MRLLQTYGLQHAMIAGGVLALALGFHFAVQSDGKVEVKRGIVVGDAHAARPSIDIAWNPESKSVQPVVLLLGGGAWIRDGGAFRANLRSIAEHGFVAVRLNYRLLSMDGPTPTNTFPTQLDDVRLAFEYLEENADQYGIDSGKVAIAGVSAGAHIGLSAGLRLADKHPVQAIVCISPPLDLKAGYEHRERDRQLIAAYLGGTPAEIPDKYRQANPIHALRKDSPPLLIFHGSDDHRVPVGQSRALSNACEELGVTHELIILDGAKHGLKAVVREQVLQKMLIFFDQQFSKTKVGDTSDSETP